jgi:hypothetical protein
VREARKHHVLEPRRLRGKRGIQRGMRVAVNVDPPGGNAVEDAAAIVGVQVHAFAAHDRQRRRRRLHLRVRVPHARAIALHEGRRTCPFDTLAMIATRVDRCRDPHLVRHRKHPT